MAGRPHDVGVRERRAGGRCGGLHEGGNREGIEVSEAPLVVMTPTERYLMRLGGLERDLLDPTDTMSISALARSTRN
eukprot:2323506-Alexandrium_andersonii.AAC.1